MAFDRTTLRLVCTAALWMTAVTVQAASGTDIETRYQQERQACVQGQTQQSRDTCLREAGAARDAAHKGALSTGSGPAASANQIERCEVFTKADEHAACIDRIRGAGNTSGSALQGGVLRESVTTTITTTEPK